MKINCLSCGHSVDLSDAYNNYKGAVKCYVCSALIQIETEDGNLRSAKLANTLPLDQADDMASPSVQ